MLPARDHRTIPVRSLVVAVLATLILALLMFAALSAPAVPEPETVRLDFGPTVVALIQFLAPIVGAVLLAIALWVLKRLGTFLGLKIDDRRRAALEQVMDRAVSYATSRLEDMAAGGIPIDMKNNAIAIVTDYALQHGPDAIKHFGKTGEELRQMAEARLEGMLIDPNIERAEPLRGMRARLIDAG